MKLIEFPEWSMIYLENHPLPLSGNDQKNQGKFMSNFFNIEEVTILKGGKISNKFPAAFAPDIAFRLINKN